MKRKMKGMLGVALAFVVIASLFSFAAPVAAQPPPPINTWYPFAFPVEGADGGWFYSSDITRVGEITEATDGTLYVHVQQCIPDATFGITTGELTVEEYDYEGSDTNTGQVVASIGGDGTTWTGPETDFVAYLDWTFTGGYDGTMCVRGHISATSLTFQGSIETLSEDDELTDLVGTWDITGGTITISSCGFYVSGGGADITINGGYTDIGASIFKSTDGGRTWAATTYPGGFVVDMAPSSLDPDILYVVDGLYVYKTSDAGATWVYVAPDSLELALAGDCGLPACCYCWVTDCPTCPSCTYYSPDNVEGWYYMFTCPITSIDVGYDAADNPYVFIGTREHCSGVNLDEDETGTFDVFPGSVYWIGEAGYPSEWEDLNLNCYSCGGYDALAVACAPDFADTKKTFVVVSTDDANCNGTPYEAGDLETHVVYTVGTVCGWYEYAELLWDCAVGNSFASAFASRIRFPASWEDTGVLYVGVTDCAVCDDCGCHGAYDTGDPYDCDSYYDLATDPTPSFGCGGDVYQVSAGGALDLNVAGFTGGCVGTAPVDIISLDIEGDSKLIAGSFCDTTVYCSVNGGWNWYPSAKSPTGEMLTYVIFYDDTALAATAGCECAVSMCCGTDYPCEFWNQISLMSTTIDCFRYIDHSPGYVCDSSYMFVLTASDGALWCEENQSLFRHDGTFWERVLHTSLVTSDLPGLDEGWNVFRRVNVSPDFNTTGAVFVHNGAFEIWRSLDKGCSWAMLRYPCIPRPCIREIVVIDEDTIIAGSWEQLCTGCCVETLGKIYKTTDAGQTPWDEYTYNPAKDGSVISFALAPGYSDPGSILIGDSKGRVFLSEDGGEIWTEWVGPPIAADADTYVVFDPGYGTSGDPGEHMFYAAAGSYIMRRDVTQLEGPIVLEDIGYMCDNSLWSTYGLHQASGIAAAGDTTLYVSDYESGGKCGVFRSVNPLDTKPTWVEFEEVVLGLDALGSYVGDYDPLWHLWLTCGLNGCGSPDSNVLWSLNHFSCADAIWVYEDTLARPVILDSPADGTKLETTDSAVLTWEKLCGATHYRLEIWYFCPGCEEKTNVLGYSLADPCIWCETLAPCDGPCSDETCCEVVEPIKVDGELVGGLLPCTTYYWRVVVCCDYPTRSKWSETWSFTTAIGVPERCSPSCGAEYVSLTPNFSWSELLGATGYEIEVSLTEDFDTLIASGTPTINAWDGVPELEFDTTYYWRVRAVCAGGQVGAWTYCIFSTGAAPVAPVEPADVILTPTPVEEITPAWLWVLIGIGAALTIAVIILIVTTRRVP